MKIKELSETAVSSLKKHYPDAICALEFDNDPWRLLVMARLSAQCTDKRVNLVCRELFSELPTAEAMANAPLEKIEGLIRSCGLFRTKASDIKRASEIIATEYGGKVPDNMDELLKLPGVGRKIANLMMGDIFGKPAIVTDTHCIRICGRLGFYDESLKDPHKIEKILVKVIPPAEQSDFCHRIVLFGRDICTARGPKCEGCFLSDVCEHLK